MGKVQRRRAQDRRARRIANYIRRLEELFKTHRARCFYCGVRVWRKKQAGEPKGTIDHVIPLSKGGGNGKSNLVLACHACNQEKGSMMPGEFVAMKRKKP